MRNRDMRESTTTTASATVNYDLPQWNGEDVTSWMTNLNDAFNKIDSAMWANHTAMAGYDKIASDLQKLAEGIQVDNEEIREALRIVQQGMADQLTQLNQAKTDITNANLAISQLQTEDNALSAMIEDLQDDIGVLSMSKIWRVKDYTDDSFKFKVNELEYACLRSVRICGNICEIQFEMINDLVMTEDLRPVMTGTTETYNEVKRLLVACGVIPAGIDSPHTYPIETNLFSLRPIGLTMGSIYLNINIRGVGATTFARGSKRVCAMVVADTTIIN